MAEGSSGHHPGGNRRPHRTGHHQLHNLSFQPMIEESFPLFTADEEVASERELLKSVEDGPYMQEVKYIIIHCSATRENRDFTVEDLLRCHRQRKFRTIGYHFYIRRSGIITQHRKLKEVGAHCRPWNRCSIGICYEGGLDAEGHPADTRTQEQCEQLLLLLMKLRKLFPDAKIRGHRNMPGSIPKACPCFDVESEFIFIERLRRTSGVLS